VREALLPRIQARISSRIRSRLDADDVLHDAFLRAMGALGLFTAKSEGSFYAWIYTISKNLMIDQSKRRSVDAQHLVAGSQADGPRVSQLEGRDGRAQSLLQRQDRIEALLRRLPEKEAELVRLHRLKGLTFEQIAEAQGKTAGAVQRAFSRVWNKLLELASESPESGSL
jgi:RNA polymerase sigma-70 factor (ECF subfamily)